MSWLKEIFDDLLITENVDVNDVVNAVENMHPVKIVYVGPSGDGNGEREICPVAYGKSEAGNHVVRAFQTRGSTSSDVPSWKFFRLDRILKWENDNSNTFNPKNLNGLNDNGDEGMEVLYTVSPIANAKNVKQPEKDEKPEKMVTSHPVSKREVQNGGADKNTEKEYYSADDAVNDIINTAIPKVEPITNKKFDNVAGQDYNSNENQPVREPIPYTKGEVDGPESLSEPSTGNPGMYADDDPVMKSDIQPDAGVQSNGELSRNFRDLTNRMDNLYKDENEEEEEL
jgi:hypothetical protein